MPLVFEGVYSDKEASEEVDEEIKRFNSFFQSIGNKPIMKFEAAILRTFLLWKAHGESSPLTSPVVHGQTSGESDAEEAGS